MKPRGHLIANYLSRREGAECNKQNLIYSPNIKAVPGKNTQKLFDQLPLLVEQTLDVSLLRKNMTDWDREFAFPYPEGISASFFQEEKIANVPASIYRTSNENELTPTVLLIHGGAFCCELKNVHKSLMANIAARIPCHGVLPHYSLAPETKLPCVINEVASVLKALLVEPERYGVSKSLVIIGYSAGGNLVWNAVLAMLSLPNTKKLVDKISRLILMSPWADISMNTTKNSSYQSQQESDKMLQIWGLEQMGSWALPDNANGTDPLFSPVYRSLSDMKGMPNTTVIAGEVECFLGDAVKTVEILREAGVSTQLIILEGQSHNHSAHVGLRDGVFTPDVIASILRDESVAGMQGDDGLGLVEDFPERLNYNTMLNSEKVLYKCALAVENDVALKTDMETWSRTISDGLHHEDV